MKTIFILCVAIFAIVQHTDAWLSYKEFTWLPGDDRTKCFLDEFKINIPMNETYLPPNKCFSVICADEGDSCMISYTGCPPPMNVVIRGVPCKVVEDKSLPFPKCCPRTDCD